MRVDVAASALNWQRKEGQIAEGVVGCALTKIIVGLIKQAIAK